MYILKMSVCVHCNNLYRYPYALVLVVASNLITLQGVGLASLAHSLFMNFETVVLTGWRVGIDCKRAGWRSGQGRGDMCGPCTY